MKQKTKTTQEIKKSDCKRTEEIKNLDVTFSVNADYRTETQI